MVKLTSEVPKRFHWAGKNAELPAQTQDYSESCSSYPASTPDPVSPKTVIGKLQELVALDASEPMTEPAEGDEKHGDVKICTDMWSVTPQLMKLSEKQLQKNISEN